MLAHSVVKPESAEPSRYMLFLHGILGTRANWRGVARRFVAARPEWGAILVDLREHGESLGTSPPHTLRAAADDLRDLEQSLGLPIAGALGHSFGGKVVLEWLGNRAGLHTEAWVIDASPSQAPADHETSATSEVLQTLDALPKRWPSREAFVEALTDAGQPEPIAHWLAMNLRRTEDGNRVFGPDLEAIRELMEDYAKTDLWNAVENPPGPCTLDVVIGGRSTAFSAADRARMTEVAAQSPRVSAHLIEAAGHWVHVDSEDALVALLASEPPG